MGITDQQHHATTAMCASHFVKWRYHGSLDMIAMSTRRLRSTLHVENTSLQAAYSSIHSTLASVVQEIVHTIQKLLADVPPALQHSSLVTRTFFRGPTIRCRSNLLASLKTSHLAKAHGSSNLSLSTLTTSVLL